MNAAPATSDLARPASKITSRHLGRRAVVYVRQSHPQQVLRHQESTRLQYQLRERAVAMGWSEEQVEVIDEDLARSATTIEGRFGFQRLVAEVSLDHVGIIVGIEMSRMSRACRDWYQLLEVCAVFGTLLADPDGIYDPANFNDRLLLGLKGTMSEAELHILKRRMLDAKRAKARRGELIMGTPPIGYVRLPSGELVKDPDEEARTIVETIFEQFVIRTTVTGVLFYLVENGLAIPAREHSGPHKGELSWRRPNRQTLQNLLKNPLYAGAYVYGRRPIDQRRKKPGRPNSGRTVAGVGEWEVCIRDKLPAYITWDRYLANQEQLRANRTDAKGVARHGPSLLSGLLKCGRCGRRMVAQYSSGRLRYSCSQEMATYAGPICQSLTGRVVDQEIERLVLEALKPAAIEISLGVAADVENQRARLEQTWHQRLERAQYEVDRAIRQYNSVEPENRLVARTLERRLEEALAAKLRLEEDYRRQMTEHSTVLNEQQRQAIRGLAHDIPSLWHAETTTVVDRKNIIRQLVDGIDVTVVDDSEKVNILIHWAGGHKTTGQIVRPVARFEQLSYFSELVERVAALRAQGRTSDEIANVLNEENWRPPKRRDTFTADMVRQLTSRRGLAHRHGAGKPTRVPGQGEDEWTLPALARELGMPAITLYAWLRKGWVRARKTTGSARWLIIASEREVNRLRRKRSTPRYRWPRVCREQKPLGK